MEKYKHLIKDNDIISYINICIRSWPIWFNIIQLWVWYDMISHNKIKPGQQPDATWCLNIICQAKASDWSCPLPNRCGRPEVETRKSRQLNPVESWATQRFQMVWMVWPFPSGISGPSPYNILQLRGSIGAKMIDRVHDAHIKVFVL